MTALDADAALVARFSRDRDEATFRQLYRRHTPALYALATRLIGRRAEAEDLVQETWVRAVSGHDRFDTQARYRAWLTAILVNCFRESARRYVRAQPAADEDAANAAVAPPTADTERADIDRALAQLAPGFREVVLLHDVSGYTHAEIADMLGIAEGTSKSQLARGRRQLRALLDGEPAPNDGDAT